MLTSEYILDSLSNQDSWRLFRIMAEVVDGFETLSHVRKSVSIFGSSRAKAGTPIYEATEAIARQLCEAGYGIITGGGPGLMEAANKGAYDAEGSSVGLHIHLPHEQQINAYVKTGCAFRYFFVRKLMFVKYAMAYVVMPGGMGTIDEFSEAFVLAQTHRIKPFPIILYDSSFWGGLVDWMKDRMAQDGYIEEKEMELFVIKDTPESVVEYIRRHVIL
ncbi:cytokinin riboside 5'-monophosphate phosphoribohydrolase [Deltaproteobacteria bacterium]|nr:cytokinin riboside 5'-monophosphate phosphoribohydrolase [Deltaproteobacteria bacterium]